MAYRINGRKVTREEFLATKLGTPIQHGDRLCIGGFEPFQSPIDGSIIASKEQLREHEKKHNVRQVGDAYLGETQKKKENFEARKAESQTEDKDFIYTNLTNPTKDIGEHYAKCSS